MVQIHPTPPIQELPRMPIILSTGRVIDHKIIGLMTDKKYSELGRLFYGHDGIINCFQRCAAVCDDPSDPEYLTPAECRELASHMIIEWTQYRDSLGESAPNPQNAAPDKPASRMWADDLKVSVGGGGGAGTTTATPIPPHHNQPEKPTE